MNTSQKSDLADWKVSQLFFQITYFARNFMKAFWDCVGLNWIVKELRVKDKIDSLFFFEGQQQKYWRMVGINWWYGFNKRRKLILAKIVMTVKKIGSNKQWSPVIQNFFNSKRHERETFADIGCVRDSDSGALPFVLNLSVVNKIVEFTR